MVNPMKRYIIVILSVLLLTGSLFSVSLAWFTYIKRKSVATFVSNEILVDLEVNDAIFIDEIRKAGLYGEIWQALACLLPVKSVGVQGDERTYEEVCSLRAVTSEDAMTADWYRFPPEVLQNAAARICNEVSGVNRVLYDITSKPPGTIEWE